jgi:hypothetical protein
MRTFILGLILTFAACPAQSAELDWTQRYTTRAFPSFASPWVATSDLSNPKDLDCRHDILWREIGEVGLRVNNRYLGLSDGFEEKSLPSALKKRADLLQCNPHALLVAEIRYRDAGANYLPANSLWWKRDPSGALQLGYPEGPLYLLDYSNPDFQAQLIRQCVAAVQSRVFDGCFFDWWKEDDAQVVLVQKLRQALGPKPLILVNVNGRVLAKTAPYINGVYMEGFGAKFFSSWQTASKNLVWFKKHLRPPAVTVFEGWYTDASLGRKDLKEMRLVTTTSLIFSDGTVLFADPNSLPTHDHLHNWYPFWTKSLGRAIAEARLNSNGTYSREYENGTVVVNPPEQGTVRLSFFDDRKSQATGKRSRVHSLANGDGDIFLR